MRLLLIILLFSQSAAANPMDIFQLGGRGQALAGAQAAKPGDSTANYYNPAAITSFDDILLDVGYQFGSMTMLINEKDSNVDPHQGITLGTVVPGDIGGVPFAIGISLFVPDQHFTRSRTLSLQQPRFMYFNNRPQRLYMALNMGVEIVDGLRFAGGLSYMTRTSGTIILDGRVGLVPEQSELLTEMDVDLLPARYGQFGLQYEYAQWLSFGLVYRTGFTQQQEQVFRIRADIGAKDLEPVVADAFFELETISRDLFQPAQLVFGAYYAPTDDLGLYLDIAWHRWSQFVTPASRINLELDLGPEFNDMVNLVPAPPIPDANFSDIIVPRFGAEWRAYRGPSTDIFLRGGYAFESSPVPDQTGETNFVDSSKHTISAGVGIQIPGIGDVIQMPVDFNLSFATTILPERETIKASPIDPIGSYRARGYTFQAAFTSNWRF